MSEHIYTQPTSDTEILWAVILCLYWHNLAMVPKFFEYSAIKF